MQDARADYLLLLSNRCRGHQALQTYRKRWGIERLFWHMKRKGFDLEATHITSAKKLDKLFAIVSLAFLVCFAWGSRMRSSNLYYVPNKANEKAYSGLALRTYLE